MNSILLIGLVAFSANVAVAEADSRTLDEAQMRLDGGLPAPILLASDTGRKTVPTGDPSSGRNSKKEESTTAPRPRVRVKPATPPAVNLPAAPAVPPPAAVTLPAAPR